MCVCKSVCVCACGRVYVCVHTPGWGPAGVGPVHVVGRAVSTWGLARGGARGRASGCSQQAIQGSLQVVVVVHQSHPSVLFIKAHLHDVLQGPLIHLAERRRGNLHLLTKYYYSTISDKISERERRGWNRERRRERKKETEEGGERRI